MTFRRDAGIYGNKSYANLFISSFKQGYQPVINRNFDKMLISTESVNKLAGLIENRNEVFCSGLFLSARWMVVSQLDHPGIQVIVLPDRDSAEYCSADLYNLIEGDRVHFLPDSGKNLERSNYKSSLGVQRTSALGKILEHKEGEQMIIVTYPAAIEESVPDKGKMRGSMLRLSSGEEKDYE